MRRAALSLAASLVIILSALPLPTQHDLVVLAQTTPWVSRSYLEIGQPTYELTSLAPGQIKVSWKVDISNKASRAHTLEVKVRFFDDKHSQVLEDTVRRAYASAQSKVTVTHETLTDTKTANSIRRAEASARQTGKARRPVPATKQAETLGELESSGERP